MQTVDSAREFGKAKSVPEEGQQVQAPSPSPVVSLDTREERGSPTTAVVSRVI